MKSNSFYKGCLKMLKRLFLLQPASLRGKLVLAFIVLILLPFAGLMLYNSAKMQVLLEEKISEQSRDNLLVWSGELNNLNRTFTSAAIMLRQDAGIQMMLKQPERMGALDRNYIAEDKFKQVTNSFFLNLPTVYYT